MNKLSSLVKYCLGSAKLLVLGLLIAVTVVGTALINHEPSAVLAAVEPASQNLQNNTNGNTNHVVIRAVSDSLNQNGEYTVNFLVTKGDNNTSDNLSVLLAVERDACIEGNGQVKSQSYRYHMPAVMPNSPYCFTEANGDQYYALNLNASNNFTQSISVTTKQQNSLACGSFQTDMWVLEVGGSDQFVLNGQLDNKSGTDKIQRIGGYVFNYGGKSYPNALAVTAGALYTGKDLGSCVVPSPSPSASPSVSPSPSPSVSPSPSPSPSVSPSPKPSASPSTVQCPVGKIGKVIDSTIVCVAQNQNQNQEQTQNNNQNQNVDQNVTANGGNSSSSSSSSSSVNLTINNPTPSATPITTVVSVPQVVTQVKGDVKELPKTGLPLAGLALGGLLPGGMAFKKRFGNKTVEESANSIWMEKQLNS